MKMKSTLTMLFAAAVMAAAAVSCGNRDSSDFDKGKAAGTAFCNCLDNATGSEAPDACLSYQLDASRQSEEFQKGFAVGSEGCTGEDNKEENNGGKEGKSDFDQGKADGLVLCACLGELHATFPPDEYEDEFYAGQDECSSVLDSSKMNEDEDDDVDPEDMTDYERGIVAAFEECMPGDE